MIKNKKIFFGFIFSILLLGMITPLFYQNVLVKAQTGYIDVYVYDAITYAPIVGDNVVLSDMMIMYVADDYTDSSGHVHFGSLDTDHYLVEVFPTGSYQYNYTFVNLVDGEGELVEFYQEPLYTPGDGFIDTYVYDSETYLPIEGAQVILRNEMGYDITYGNTDVTGYYNFTDLGPGTYELYANNESYNEGWVFATIDYDGEAELAEIYLNPAYTPGNGFIDVYVYDNVTLTPIEDAYLTLYDEYNYVIDWGSSDATGFYNFTGLGIGEYLVSSNKMDYIQNSSIVYIDYDGESEYLMLYLNPVIRTLDILSPSDSQTVEGGMVLIEFDASDSSQLQYIEIYVNAEYITKIDVYGTLTDFFVPVFNNGTNTIYLEGYWNDMSTGDDTVDINSVNVIPTVDIKEGDWLNYKQFDLVNVETYDANFTFTTWLSTFEMLTHYSVHRYDSGGTISQDEFWLTINVLNGYVSVDPSGSMLTWHFFPFACLPPNPIVGDQSVWVPWNNLMTVNGSTPWEYTDVWTLDAYGGNLLLYVEKNTNIVHYLMMPGFMEMILLNTSIDFLDPFVTDEADFGYTLGDTGNIISWDATDRFPGTYIISKDGGYVDGGYWNSITPIAINVDGLTAGTYVYLVVITDLSGRTAQDTVIVTVNPVVPEFNSIRYLICIPIIVLATHFLISKRKRKNK